MTFRDPWAESQANYMAAKLRAVGATRTEIVEFMEQWLHDPTWPHDDKVRVLALGDGRLRLELDQTRAAGLADTESHDDERERLAREADARTVAALRRQAEAMGAYDPPQIMEWVGQSLPRARVMLDVEERNGVPRASLITVLLRVIEAHVQVGT